MLTVLKVLSFMQFKARADKYTEKKSKNEVVFKREKSIMGLVSLISQTPVRVFSGNITMCWLYFFLLPKYLGFGSLASSEFPSPTVNNLHLNLLVYMSWFTAVYIYLIWPKGKQCS